MDEELLSRLLEAQTPTIRYLTLVDLLGCPQRTLGSGGLDAVIDNASVLGPSPQPFLLDYPLAALEQLSAVLAVENEDWRVYWVDPGDMRTHGTSSATSMLARHRRQGLRGTGVQNALAGPGHCADSP